MQFGIIYRHNISKTFKNNSKVNVVELGRTHLIIAEVIYIKMLLFQDIKTISFASKGI